MAQLTNNEYKSSTFQQTNTFSQQLTYKIKDGLYLGTSLQVFKDQQFILLNYIEHIVVFEINGGEFKEQWKQMYKLQNNSVIEQSQEQIKYLHVNQTIFQQKQQQETCEPQDSSSHSLNKSSNSSIIQEIQDIQRKYVKCFDEIFEFIQESSELGSSCLILLICPDKANHYYHQIGHIFCLATCYLLSKFHWSLYKSLQYMNSRVKGVKISQPIYEYFKKFQIEILNKYNLTYDWKSWKTQEELIVRNTYVNTMGKPIILKEEEGRKRSPRHESPLKKQSSISKPKSKFEHSKQKSKGNISILAKDSIESFQKLKPILKAGRFNLSTKTRLQFNLQLNRIKQYMKTDQTIDGRDESQLQVKKQKSQISHSTQKIRQISLCVKEIVCNYKRDRKNSSMTRGLGTLYFDDCYQLNLKRLKKHKSLGFVKYFEQPQQKSDKSLSVPDITGMLKKLKEKKSEYVSEDFLRSEQTEITDSKKQGQSSKSKGKNLLVDRDSCQDWQRILHNNKLDSIVSMSKDSRKLTPAKKSSKDKQNMSRALIKEPRLRTENSMKQNSQINIQIKSNKVNYEDFKAMLLKKQGSGLKGKGLGQSTSISNLVLKLKEEQFFKTTSQLQKQKQGSKWR